jgi:hypothetical protein
MSIGLAPPTKKITGAYTPPQSGPQPHPSFIDFSRQTPVGLEATIMPRGFSAPPVYNRVSGVSASIPEAILATLVLVSIWRAAPW